MGFPKANRLAYADTSAFRTAIYCLSLTGYCIYWTYYGLISTGGRYTWNYIQVFLAPIAAVFVFYPLLNRIAHVSRRENFSSMADLLSARYGKSPAVGLAVTAITFIGTIPFIGQQLRFLSLAWVNIQGNAADPVLLSFILSLVLIGFVILLSARRPTVTEHSNWLIQLIAADAVVKFLAILVLAAASVVYLAPHASDVKAGIANGALIAPLRLDGGFFNTFFLLTASTLCMPHLFHIGIINAESPDSLRKARWFLPPYFLLLCLITIPVFLAGRHLFGTSVDPEMYVIRLASHFSGPAAATIFYLSSIWTTTLLVSIATSVLSGMISHQLAQSRLIQSRKKADVDFGRDAMNMRRVAIIVIILLGLVCALPVTQVFRVGNIGILYTSIFVQLLPCLIGAVFWTGGHRSGVLAGLAAGATLWLVLIAVPYISGQGFTPLVSLQLAQIPVTSAFVQRFLVCLMVNTALYIVVSKLARQRLVDRIQGAAFIDTELAGSVPVRELTEADINILVGDLKALIIQFLGERDASAAIADLERETEQKFHDGDKASPALVEAMERILAGVVGAPLAHSVIFWQLVNKGPKSGEVVRFLDETAQAVKLNRETLQATLNNLSQGVCVVDKNFGLVAWNDRYLEIFDLPAGFIRVGTSLADIIWLNRSRTGYSAQDTEIYVRRRMRDIRLGIPHVFERVWKDGKILRVIGMPMSDGRYVTSFTDVTSVQDVVTDLRRANEKLEERVEERTQKLIEVNDALQESTRQAERARASQARFLAAASHDLLQPLHAARLFLGALQEHSTIDMMASDLAKSADVSIESANRLLRALLNLSRLEIGGIRPETKPVDAGLLLEELLREFQPSADVKGLRFRIVPTKYWVLSDADLLRSVLQNLIGNALRYTDKGSVLVICRRDANGLRFEVRDSGPGIPEAALANIFKEYVRLQPKHEAQGTGLGLSIVERICHVLHYPVSVRSAPGKGSTFMVTVPLAPRAVEKPHVIPAGAHLAGLKVLCVEHEVNILQSLQVLFERWQVKSTFAKSIPEALAISGSWDVVLTDYHFGAGQDGLDLVECLRGRALVFALITADSSEEVLQRAAAKGVEVIRKPVSPAALRTFLSHVGLTKTERPGG